MELKNMESEYGYCCEKKSKCKKCNCLEVIAAIVGALFALVIVRIWRTNSVARPAK